MEPLGSGGNRVRTSAQRPDFKSSTTISRMKSEGGGSSPVGSGSECGMVMSFGKGSTLQDKFLSRHLNPALHYEDQSGMLALPPGPLPQEWENRSAAKRLILIPAFSALRVQLLVPLAKRLLGGRRKPLTK